MHCSKIISILSTVNDFFTVRKKMFAKKVSPEGLRLQSGSKIFYQRYELKSRSYRHKVEVMDSFYKNDNSDIISAFVVCKKIKIY